MSADFWAGYLSGAVGIVIGNPLDLIKTRIQAGPSHLDSVSNTQHITPTHWSRQFERWSALVRGAAAPILGYGALNALLFMTYNRSLALLNTGDMNEWPENPTAGTIWTAGALGGLAGVVVSAATELVGWGARVAFGGGGHRLAAGCTMKPPIEDAAEQILTLAKELLHGICE